MTVTLTPVERTNWALSAWNSTLDWNDVPSAWLYGQDHLWATQDLVCSPGVYALKLFFIQYKVTCKCIHMFCTHHVLI